MYGVSSASLDTYWNPASEAACTIRASNGAQMPAGSGFVNVNRDPKLEKHTRIPPFRIVSPTS